MKEKQPNVPKIDCRYVIIDRDMEVVDYRPSFTEASKTAIYYLNNGEDGPFFIGEILLTHSVTKASVSIVEL